MGIDIHSHTGLVPQNAAPDVPLQLQHLPVDVERLIVEVAAEQGTQTALQLIRVCHSYRTWLYPILYRTACLKSNHQAGLFSTVLLQPSLNLPSRVRVLSLSNDVDPSTVAEIVPMCTNIISLSYWRVRSKTLPSPPIDLYPCRSLRRLSIDLSHVVAGPDEPLPSDHPLRRVERLDVCSPDLYKWRLIISELSELTHLFFCEDYPSRIPSRASMSPLMPPNLRVCIIHVAASLTHHETVQLEQYINGKADPRVVIGADSYRPLDHEVTPNLLLRSFTKLLADWSGASSETLDFWDLAEEIICVRRVAEGGDGQGR